MGWWLTNEEGHSLLEEGEMIWGDGPADTLSNALDDIVGQFEQKWGRKPSVAEIIAGVRFSMGETGLPR
jgi:hypothetical protein